MRDVTNDELIAVAEGSADRLTERRVLAAALGNPALQRRLEALRAADALAASSLPELTTAERAGFHERLRVATRQVGREVEEQKVQAVELPIARPAWIEQVGRPLQEILRATVARITLPALVPAHAASEPSLEVIRQVLEAEKVHIEIHQLPGTPLLLRFLADASRSSAFVPNQTAGVALVFQEEGAAEPWVELIALNAEGRGFLERVAPAVTGAIELVGVALVTL